MDLSNEAFLAGQIPKRIPILAEKNVEIKIDSGVIVVFHLKHSSVGGSKHGVRSVR